MVGQVVLYIRKHGHICRVAFLIVLLGISMKSRQTVEASDRADWHACISGADPHDVIVSLTQWQLVAGVCGNEFYPAGFTLPDMGIHTSREAYTLISRHRNILHVEVYCRIGFMLSFDTVVLECSQYP